MPALARGAPEVVAGDRSLDRPIRWVHIGENPEIAAWLEGGELLLTSGLRLDPQPLKLSRFVDELADRGLAALVLELGPKFEQVPPAMVEAAERSGLPVVALHEVIRFMTVTESIHSEIIDRQLSLLRRGDEVHKRFSRLLLDGAGVAEILVALAEIVGNPVVLERRGRGIMYQATGKVEESRVTAAWRAHQRQAGCVESLAQPVLTGGDQPWGNLIMFPLSRPLSSFDEVAAERAAGLISLTLAQYHHEDLLAARGTGNMLRSIMEGRLDDVQAENAARALGFVARGDRLLPVVAARTEFRAGARTDESWQWADVSAKLSSELAGGGIQVLAGVSDSNDALLLVLDLATKRADVADAVAKVIRGMVARRGQGEAVVCVAGSARSWTEVRDGLLSAIRAVPAAIATPERAWYDASLPTVDGLLSALDGNPEAADFVRGRLKGLMEHDLTRHPKLLGTLEAYFANGMSKTETARALHLERQSLYHRLARIEELIGEKLDGEETLFGVQLALRIHRLMNDREQRSGADQRSDAAM